VRIIVDLDEVIVNFIDPLLLRHYKNTGEKLTRDDITDWQLEPELIKIFMEEEGFFLPLSPFLGAIPALKFLSKEHRIIIATSHSGVPRIAMEKMAWIKVYLPWLAKDAIITENKSNIRGDMIIDDSVRNLQHFLGVTVVMDRPYNRHYDADERVYDWDDILYIVELYEGKRLC
jgi:5'(3')-deoxyribonucleotidase